MEDEPIVDVPHNPPACQWSSNTVISNLSRAPIGRELAAKVASTLNKSSLHHSHRDYCGHGLWKIENGRVSLGAASDGDEFQEVVGFDDEESFIAWLAKQTDYSLAGADPEEPHLHTSSSFELNNQRLSKARLEAFVAQYLKNEA